MKESACQPKTYHTGALNGWSSGERSAKILWIILLLQRALKGSFAHKSPNPRMGSFFTAKLLAG